MTEINTHRADFPRDQTKSIMCVIEWCEKHIGQECGDGTSSRVIPEPTAEQPWSWGFVEQDWSQNVMQWRFYNEADALVFVLKWV